MVADRQQLTTKKGDPYLNLKLIDKTGSIQAKVWSDSPAFDKEFGVKDTVGVSAKVGSYQGALQLTINDLKLVDEPEKYMDRFLATTDRDPSGMLGELKEHASTIEDEHVRRLAMSLLEDEEFAGRFAVSSAAKGLHHVFAGGLLQHTLKVVRLCDLIHMEYQENDPGIAAMIDRDLLICGAVFHDIGKVGELSPEPGFDYTTDGRLLGHVAIGLMWLKGRIEAVEGFPADKARLLMHMILSHHGEYEFGSPKRPKCIEAFILHYADNLDAKLQGLYEFIESDSSEGEFTAYNRLYGRFFYKGAVEPE
jgi:3'-5' exoribonuclease